MQLFRRLLLVSVTAGGVALLACGDSDSTSTPTDGGAIQSRRGDEPAGQACTAPSQCYGDLEADAGIAGEVICLRKVPNGYCTHTCEADTDCCAVPGECITGVKEVCSPLENQDAQYCFLSCEEDDIARAIAANGDAGYYDGAATDSGSVADAYCQSYAGAATSCRSSGGGSKNRKICLPT